VKFLVDNALSPIVAERLVATNSRRRIRYRPRLCKKGRASLPPIKPSLIKRKRAPENDVQELDRRKPYNATQSALATLFTPMMMPPLATLFTPMLVLTTLFTSMMPLATLFTPMLVLFHELNGQRRRGYHPDRGTVDDRGRRNGGGRK
jgi:hypothetical protein